MDSKTLESLKQDIEDYDNNLYNYIDRSESKTWSIVAYDVNNEVQFCLKNAERIEIPFPNISKLHKLMVCSWDYQKIQSLKYLDEFRSLPFQFSVDPKDKNLPNILKSAYPFITGGPGSFESLKFRALPLLIKNKFVDITYTPIYKKNMYSMYTYFQHEIRQLYNPNESYFCTLKEKYGFNTPSEEIVLLEKIELYKMLYSSELKEEAGVEDYHRVYMFFIC